MENLEMIKPKRVQNIINKFCLTIGMLPTSYKISMTYEEQILAIGHYLETTVYPAINNNAEALAELQNLFIELKNYVDNYFDDLDIQAEINNKLDDMAQSGELAEIIAQYIELQGLLCYDSVNDMKNATNLVNGSFAKTYGFYAKNDGGGAFYKIRTVTNEDVVNNMNLIALSNDNSLVAELMTDIVNVLQFGAKGDGITNDTLALQTASNYAENNNLEFFVPNKTYLSDTFTLNNIKFIKILGHIKMINENTILNVFENVNNGNSVNIFINKVYPGTIEMKGLNSADVTIQNAYKLRLVADNTENHGFIGYTKFYLGFVRYLELWDDGSGTKWINENLFIGGRFLGISIDGTYSHQDNLFLKPMCENTEIVINKGHGNRLIDARLEGENTSITFGSDTFQNIIVSNYASPLQNSLLPKNFSSLNVIDNSGNNKVIINNDLKEFLPFSLNKFNKPSSYSVVDDKVVYDTNSFNLYETDLISIDDLNTDINLFLNTTEKNIVFKIEAFDSTGTRITINPDLLRNSPTLAWSSNGYLNQSYNRNTYWAIIDHTKTETVKFIKIKIFKPSSVSSVNIKNIDLYLTHYGKIDNIGYLLKGIEKNTIQ